MIKSLLPVFGCCYYSIPLQKCLLEIISLILPQEKLCSQCMELFLLHGRQFVDDLNDWVVESKRIRIHVAAELIGNEHLAGVFNLQDEALLN